MPKHKIRKHNLLMKFGQFMSYYKRKNFIKKLYKNCGLVPGPFVFAKTVSSRPPKRGEFHVFKIWKKRGFMKKLLRNRMLRGVPFRKGGGGFPNCFTSFSSEKHVFITIGILFFSFFVW